MFSATEDPVISRYDDADDMDAARMPETTKPQKKAGSIIWASTMKMLSAADWVSSPPGRMARPIKPIMTAQKSDITTQTMAMIRLCLTSESERMPMKRTSTWGMPK